MAQYLPKLRVRSGEQIGNELFFAFPDLQDEARTYLTDDILAGVTNLPADGVDFAANQYVVIGQPGNVGTEIVQISGTPSATAITVGATLFPHNRGDVVRFIPFNQIVPSWSATVGGSYSALSALAIRADSTESYLNQTADPSTYWYKYQFFNSTSGLYSAYSDTVSGVGFADNTIGSVKQRALDQLGEKLSTLITDRKLNDWIQEARRLADYNPAVFRWSFRTSFNNVVGQMLAGQWRIAIPANLRDPNSPKNVLSIRCANQNRQVGYQDRVRWNLNYLNIKHSTVATQALANANTLVLTNSADLGPSGALTIANNNIGDGLIVINFTGNNQLGTLTGVTGINRTILVGTDVWGSGAVFGLPTFYTVGGDGYWYFDVPMKLDYDGMNVKSDIYTTIPAITTDDQQFDEPFWDLYVSYLKWKIKYAKANGKIARDGDTDWKDWENGLMTLIGQEFPGQRISFVPDVDGFLGDNSY